MNATLQALARDKEILLTRSALGRLRLSRATHNLRSSLQWRRAAVASATAPAMGRFALGLALTFAGPARAARWVMVAGRVILFAKLTGAVFSFARRLAEPSAPAIAQAAARIE